MNNCDYQMNNCDYRLLVKQERSIFAVKFEI